MPPTPPQESWTPDRATPGLIHRGDAEPVTAPTSSITDSNSAENPVWNGWDVVVFAVVAVVSLFVAGTVLTIVFFAGHGMKTAKPEDINADLRFILPVQIFSYAVMVATMYATVRVRYGRPFLAAIRWNWAQIRPWMFVAFGIGLAILSQLSELVLRVPKDLPIQKFFATTTGAYLMGVLGVVIAPIVEELFFRAFMYPVIARRLGMIGGILITGGLFALLHGAQLAYSWAALVIMFLIGIALTTVRAITKSVAASTITHITYNFVLMATLWVATDHFHHLDQIGR
jgi:membrane protease YdiL (CAAX protease family)